MLALCMTPIQINLRTLMNFDYLQEIFSNISKILVRCRPSLFTLKPWPLFISLTHCFSRCLTFSQSPSDSLTRSHSHSLSFTLSHSLSRSFSVSLSVSRARSLLIWIWAFGSLSFSLSHPLTLLSHSLTLSHVRCLSLSRSLSDEIWIWMWVFGSLSNSLALLHPKMNGLFIDILISLSSLLRKWMDERWTRKRNSGNRSCQLRRTH